MDSMRFFRCLSMAAAIFATAVPLAGGADGEVVAVPFTDVLRDVATARFVQVTSYTIPPRSPLRHALTLACLAGAHVGVLISASDLGGIGRANDDFAASMRLFGFAYEAAGSPPGGARCAIRKSRRALHMKSVYAANLPNQPDRRVLYLSDENFSNGYYVRDERESDKLLVAKALSEDAGSDGRFFSTQKSQSLALEAQAVSAARGTELVVESESFGPGNTLTDALERRAQGIPVRLLIASREYGDKPAERAYVRELIQRYRINVRLSAATDKLAVSGDVFWIGSTNSTRGYDEQIDWGLAGVDAGLATMARQVFEHNWSTSTPAL